MILISGWVQVSTLDVPGKKIYMRVDDFGQLQVMYFEIKDRSNKYMDIPNFWIPYNESTSPAVGTLQISPPGYYFLQAYKILILTGKYLQFKNTDSH